MSYNRTDLKILQDDEFISLCNEKILDIVEDKKINEKDIFKMIDLITHCLHQQSKHTISQNDIVYILENILYQVCLEIYNIDIHDDKHTGIHDIIKIALRLVSIQFGTTCSFCGIVWNLLRCF